MTHAAWRCARRKKSAAAVNATALLLSESSAYFLPPVAGLALSFFGLRVSLLDFI
jgi:hypothetical protein